MRSLGRLAFVAVLGLFAAGCSFDGPSYLVVDNQTDATYVAQVGDGPFLVIPPKRRVTISQIGFTEQVPPTQVRLLDASCSVVATLARGQAAVLIDKSGAVTVVGGNDPARHQKSVDMGPGDTAQASRFCADASPSVSPSPAPS